ncbi:MAG: triose-phosphate isomerase family protein, partial [Gammaproteobacteria bacterium]
MRSSLVAGNWKMNGSRESVTRLVGDILAGLDISADTQVLVCPPFVYLADMARLLKGSALLLGAQDVCAEDDGAHTGEVSGAMLRDLDCRYVIVGHSERRAQYGETDLL